VGGKPLIRTDPLGLIVIGSWIESPKFNLMEVSIDNWEVVSPSWSWWGYIKFIRLHGHAMGFVNVDVKCQDECVEWELHNEIPVYAQGHFDTGPNLYAFLIGLRAGVLGGVAANVVIAGIAMLQAELHYLGLVYQEAGPIISAVHALGPTGICMGSTPYY
jgi:hypothetical protein